MAFLLCFFFLQTDPPPSIPSDFLSQALKLHERAVSLEDPRATSDYAVLLLEKYSREVAFRGFFMRDLLPGESLPLLRRRKEEIAGNDRERLVQLHLGDLLIEAQKKYPEDQAVRFAIAHLNVKAFRYIQNPDLRMTPSEVEQIFLDAEKKGRVSGTSLYFLAMNALKKEESNAGEILERLEKAHRLLPWDTAITLALGNRYFTAERYQDAVQAASLCFDEALSPEFRVEALALAARSFLALESYDRALTAVDRGLSIDPGHTLLWILGLDAYRALENPEAYAAHIQSRLQLDPFSPTPFQDYIDYLTLRGITAQDRAFIATYQKQTPSEPLAAVVQALNNGKFYINSKEYDQARAWFDKAESMIDQVQNAPVDLQSVVDAFQDMLEGSP